MKKPEFGIVSIYVSFAFLILSRLIYSLDAATLPSVQPGDYGRWMIYIPTVIRAAILIPLAIGLFIIFRCGINALEELIKKSGPQ